VADPVVRISPFDLPADSREVRMVEEWREAGGKLKDLFRISLSSLDRSGKFSRLIEELLDDAKEKEKQDDDSNSEA
jgi:hypothetical protein